MKRCGFDDIVVARDGVEHGKTIVVFGGNDYVTHAGIFDGADPSIGVEIGRVKAADDITPIDCAGNSRLTLDVLGVTPIHFPLPFAAQRGRRVPMDEATEPRLAPPTETLVTGLRGVAPPLEVGTVV